jgi:nucleotide-binding universal stress UspA family protein
MESGMRNIKKILVPVDFCEESAAALKRALALAIESRAEVIALHVIDAYSLRDHFTSTRFSRFSMSNGRLVGARFPVISLQALLSERTAKLSRFVNRHIRQNDRIVISQKVSMGGVVKEIATIAHEEDIDLLVIELRKNFPSLNLTVLKLLQMSRHIACPVLLEPALRERRWHPIQWLAGLLPVSARA